MDAFAEHWEEAGSVYELIRELVDSNLDSIRIAKDLMLAQELADLHTSRMESAIDVAADSGGDATAIDDAVASVRAAEQASAAELGAAECWGLQLERIQTLAARAEALLSELIPLERATAS